MFRKLKKFAMSRTGRRVISWAAPIVAGWLARRLSRTGRTQTSNAKKTK